eukprot:TRINITY_DN6675_c0_g1_i1.p1 TRINITY_DN6675_c0_g1~~TRINITY_DN6675_c0_g1_i1.p1  ORF type:complete len:307 (+),score=42.76 TRINITY_DN6675_c0_g1_i1:191-1111(+)
MRKHCHDMGSKNGLGSRSKGTGKNRFITLYKSDAIKIVEQREVKKNNKLPKGMSQIIEGFYWLGSGRDARDKDELLKNGVTHLLNITKEWQEYHRDAFIIHRIEIFDYPNLNISDHFEEAFNYIESVREDNGKVLVHCVAGKSRSVSVTIAYLMKFSNMTLREAYNHVKLQRDIIRPNSGFMHQLIEFEINLYGVSTMAEGDWEDSQGALNGRTRRIRDDPIVMQNCVRELLPEDILVDCALLLEEEYVKSNIHRFVSSVMQQIQQNDVPTAIICEKYNLKWKHVKKNINDTSRSWFVSRISADDF